MIHENEFVCFCLGKRHPNVFMGRRLPSNCRYCNAQFDLMSIIPKAEAEAKGLLKMPEEAAPTAQSEEPAAPTATPPARPAAVPPQPAGLDMNRPAAPTAAQPVQTGFGMNKPAAPTPAQPVQPGFSINRPAAPAPAQPVQPGFGMNRPAVPITQQPPRSGFGTSFSSPMTSYAAPAVRECRLDYFGETIEIPREGGWIGRSAIGTEWFKGNLLVSREHIKVLPMVDGCLQVGPDKSLNGTSITVGGTKRALERSETVTLSPGDTLWLYNIPLHLKRN